MKIGGVKLNSAEMRELIISMVVLLATGVACSPTGGRDVQFNTNIAVVNPGEPLNDSMSNAQGGVTVLDLSKMMDTVSGMVDDIVEDKRDPFITGDKGDLRPKFVGDDQDWAEPIISNSMTRPLHRVKRCGGGGGGDDGGDANRARRANRRRAARRRRAQARRASKNKNSTTTTVVRKVIQDGRVISETVVPQTTTVQHQPVVQAVVPQQQPVVVQQPVPVVAAQQAPAVSQVAAQPQLPKISVQGSVNVN